MGSNPASRCLCRLFRSFLQVHKVEGAVAVAVSGGADSMCVAHLAQRATCGTSRCHMACAHEDSDSHALPLRSVQAISIDHGIREESVRETRDVLLWCQQHGVACDIVRLQWPQGHTPRRSTLLAEARRLRYRALADACTQSGAKFLLTGHHAGASLHWACTESV